jgi:hypothetical protein
MNGYFTLFLYIEGVQMGPLMLQPTWNLEAMAESILCSRIVC